MRKKFAEKERSRTTPRNSVIHPSIRPSTQHLQPSFASPRSFVHFEYQHSTNPRDNPTSRH